ncbi:hypothetical protein [Janibacter limosus]|uniref:hypothetical protein n=1 Tax=Janibacter limosus TaxID=53458 RepID=UPI0013EEA135|nr:hypothetical protein [Janibacter limosus]
MTHPASSTLIATTDAITPRHRSTTFWAAASVLALALWSSGAPSVLYPIYAARWA